MEWNFSIIIWIISCAYYTMKNMENDDNCCIFYLEFKEEFVRGRLTQIRPAAKKPTIFVLLMKVFLLHESGVYRQLACLVYILMMKIIENNCHENTKTIKAMSTIVYYESFIFSTLGLNDESEGTLRYRILSLIT